jgi:hypothetical protein
MESEQSLTPHSDVDHGRRERATPFSYRSALHTLLGMSDVEGGQVSYARMIPPVEWRDTPQPLPGQSWDLQEAWQETDPSGFDEASAHDTDRSTGSPGAAAPHHGPLQEQALERRSSHRSESRYGQTPSPSTGEGRGGGEARRGSQSPSLPLPPHPLLPPSGGKGQDLTGVLALLGVPPQPGPVPAAQTAQTLEASSQARPGASAHARGAGAATARVERPDEGVQEITIAVPGTSERPRHFPALAPEKQEDRPVSTAEESEAGAIGRLQGQVESSINGDVAASIEQLRRTVRELAAKVAARQARTQDETPPPQTVQTPPHAAPRVVIIKPTAPRSGPPRAFWERRYLGRVSWRTLR